MAEPILLLSVYVPCSALERAVIFIDEADTMFGSLDSSSHETERRLTGKVRAMMSDPRMKGGCFWLLMTARVRLSPDIRRPGRVGDVIIPILDPAGDDRRDFVRWLLSPTTCGQDEELVERIYQASFPTSAADFAALRSELKAKSACKTELRLMTSQTSSNLAFTELGPVRRYQTLPLSTRHVVSYYPMATPVVKYASNGVMKYKHLKHKGTTKIHGGKTLRAEKLRAQENS